MTEGARRIGEPCLFEAFLAVPQSPFPEACRQHHVGGGLVSGAVEDHVAEPTERLRHVLFGRHQGDVDVLRKTKSFEKVSLLGGV